MRVFVCVELNAAVRERVWRFVERVRRQLDDSLRVSWTPPDNLHLTLKFLGEVDNQRIDAIGRALRDALSNECAFDIAFTCSGVFPNWREPRVLWVGVADGATPVQRLHDCCEAALQPLGFPQESRPFRVHLTVGRLKTVPPRRVVESLHLAFTTSEAFGRCAVAEVVLMRSHLHPRGAIYTPIARFPMAPRSSSAWAP